VYNVYPFKHAPIIYLKHDEFPNKQVKLTACRTCLFLQPSWHSLASGCVPWNFKGDACRSPSFWDRNYCSCVLFFMHSYIYIYIVWYASCIYVINIGIWEDG